MSSAAKSGCSRPCAASGGCPRVASLPWETYLMKKFGKNAIAVGLVTLLVTAGLSFSANGADEPVAQSKANAVIGTGIFDLLNGTECAAAEPGTPDGAPAEDCGDGLNLNDSSVTSYTQTATAGADGTSNAHAGIAGTGVIGLGTTLDLTGVIDG